MLEEPSSFYTQNRQLMLDNFSVPEDLLPEEPRFDSTLQVVDGKRGLPTLQGKDDQGVYFLHSPYDPMKEAATHLDTEYAPGELENGQTNFIVVMGFGLGYLIEELLHRVPERSIIVVVIPDPVHFQQALSTREFSKVLVADNLFFISGDDPQYVARSVADSVDFNRLSRWKMVLTRPMLRLYPQYSRNFIDAISSALTYNKTAFNTTVFHGHQFLSNALKNLWWVYDAPGIDSLVGRWQNRPAVIVAAGPSLHKQLPLLYEYQDRILVIAALQAVPALRKANITPHVVVVIDPKLDTSDFQSAPREGFSLLAIDIATHPESVRHGHGALIVGHALPDNQVIFQDFHGTKGVWNCGGSVATNAFEVALRSGASPILLIGQDLALTGGVSHGEHYRHGTTSIDELQKTNPSSLREIEGYHGDLVFTTQQFDTYRHWFENRIANLPTVQVVNCTEGGARIHGAVQQPFAEALHACALETPIDPDRIRNWSEPLTTLSPKGLRKNIAKVRTAITAIEKRALLLRKQVEREIKQTPEDAPSGLPMQLQRPILQLLKNKSSAVLLIEQLVQPEIFMVQRALEKQENSRLEQLQAVQQLAMACIKASRDAIEQLDHLPTPENG